MGYARDSKMVVEARALAKSLREGTVQESDSEIAHMIERLVRARIQTSEANTELRRLLGGKHPVPPMKVSPTKGLDLQATGLLWLINRVVFHPRGFSLAIQEEEGEYGFVLLGNGKEVWRFDSARMEDQKFEQVEKLFTKARRRPS